ncbi:hypothetical protein R3P38DRAFT_2793871 [Favolaschia claudopus]|uniref:Uncharacterized protein n=1 Tax=Favolaschia claudopus TaxID=2862362 RepID=A0AAW0ABR7_9AGAR
MAEETQTYKNEANLAMVNQCPPGDESQMRRLNPHSHRLSIESVTIVGAAEGVRCGAEDRKCRLKHWKRRSGAKVRLPMVLERHSNALPFARYAAYRKPQGVERKNRTEYLNGERGRMYGNRREHQMWRLDRSFTPRPAAEDDEAENGIQQLFDVLMAEETQTYKNEANLAMVNQCPPGDESQMRRLNPHSHRLSIESVTIVGAAEGVRCGG